MSDLVDIAAAAIRAQWPGKVMAEYANVGGKQVLVCDIREWLENRGLVAVPRFATDAMLEAGNANIKYQIEEDPERSGTPAWPYASTVWNAMVQAAEHGSTPPVDRSGSGQVEP